MSKKLNACLKIALHHNTPESEAIAALMAARRLHASIGSPVLIIETEEERAQKEADETTMKHLITSIPLNFLRSVIQTLHEKAFEIGIHIVGMDLQERDKDKKMIAPTDILIEFKGGKMESELFIECLNKIVEQINTWRQQKRPSRLFAA